MKRLVLPLLLLAIALCLPAFSGATKPKPKPKKPIEHKLYVYGPEGKVVATFTKAKCSRTTNSSGKSFFAKMRSPDGEVLAFVKVFDFAGFKKEYEVEQGPPDPNPAISVTYEDKNYSSAITPPFEAPGFGEVLFREGGRLLGVGYGPAMFTRGNYEEGVFLTGVVECEYPKKGKKGKG